MFRHIPDDYQVLFLPGGGSGQFAGIAMNLMGLKESRCADYVITGTWSAKAAKEAEKYGKVHLVFPKRDKYHGEWLTTRTKLDHLDSAWPLVLKYIFDPVLFINVVLLECWVPECSGTIT